MNMLELQPDAAMKANKTTYTYDQYDRVYLKNYYLGTIPRSRHSKTKPDINLSTHNTVPKKLLYQDVYRYKSNTANEPYFIDRVYQPVISTPVLSVDNNNNLIMTSTVVCKSPIVQSGFIYSDNVNNIATRTLYPDKRFWNLGNGYQYSVLGNSGLGKITFIFNYTWNTVYVKAYCTMETGVLFSPAVVYNYV